MAYNVPSYTHSRFSFGPGILYLGSERTTPLGDLGAVKGSAELSIERTRLEIWQGSPQSKIKQYAIKEEVILKVTGIEWNFDNFNAALGAGVTGASNPEETFEFGGDMDVADKAVRFLHRTPDGGTIDIHLFKAEGAGKIAITFNEADTHEFPYEFHAVEATTGFDEAALAAQKKLFKVIRTAA